MSRLSRMLTLSVAAVAVAALLFLGGTPHRAAAKPPGGGGGGGGTPPVTYSVTWLGTLGGPRSQAQGMNYFADVVGWSTPAAGPQSAFLSFVNNQGTREMIDLNDLLPPDSGWRLFDARAINNDGQIVGRASYLTPFMQRGYRLTLGTDANGDLYAVGIDLIGSPDESAPGTIATGINDFGEVSVSVDFVDADHPESAAVWTEQDGLVDLGSFAGAHGLVPSTINNVGQVTGFSRNADVTTFHAWRFTPGSGMQDLGLIRGKTGFSMGNDINDSGDVVGMGSSGNKWHAFRFTTTGGMADLGTLGGGYSHATGINASGDVIGLAETSSGATHPFLHHHQHGMLDLAVITNFPAGTDHFSVGSNFGPARINSWGAICGGVGPAVQQQAYLLTPNQP